MIRRDFMRLLGMAAASVAVSSLPKIERGHDLSPSTRAMDLLTLLSTDRFHEFGIVGHDGDGGRMLIGNVHNREWKRHRPTVTCELRHVPLNADIPTIVRGVSVVNPGNGLVCCQVFERPIVLGAGDSLHVSYTISVNTAGLGDLPEGW